MHLHPSTDRNPPPIQGLAHAPRSSTTQLGATLNIIGHNNAHLPITLSARLRKIQGRCVFGKCWRTGLERAASVCAVRQKLGQRFGSGFMLKAGALGLQPPDEPVVLTNFHV